MPFIAPFPVRGALRASYFRSAPAAILNCDGLHGFGVHLVAATFEARHDRQDRLRPAEEVALTFVAAQAADQFELLLGLDALGRRRHAEAAREFHDGLHDGLAVGPRVRLADEHLVDLDLVEGEAAQVVERGETGAEIIEHDADAKRMQAVQARDDLFAALEQGRFRDLEFQAGGIEARGGERRADHVDDLVAAQLHGREVDRKLAVRRQRDHGAAGFIEAPGADRADHVELFRERDELGRGHGAAPVSYTHLDVYKRRA